MIANILIGLFMVGITVAIHAFGTIYLIRVLHHRFSKLEVKKHNTRVVSLLIYTSIFITFLNTCEAIIWALLYYFLPEILEINTLEEAIYFSLVTFTTLGFGDVTIGPNYRILTGIEAMNGILLIGWSTALMFATVQSIWKRNWKNSTEK